MAGRVRAIQSRCRISTAHPQRHRLLGHHSDLVVALFTGNITDILIGLYYVGPLALGILFSVIGLILETVIGPQTATVAVSD